MKRFAFACLVAGFVSVLVAPATKAQESSSSIPEAAPVSKHVLPVVAEGPSGDSCGEPRGAEGCGCRPRWTIYGGFLYMKLERPSDRPIVNFPGGVTRLNARDLTYHYAPAFEIGAIAPLGEKWEVEGRFMDQENWTAHNLLKAPNPTAGASIQTNPPTLLNIPFGANFDTTYETNLRSAELILSRRVADWLRIGAGFRWLQLTEELTQRIEQLNAGGAVTDRALASFSTQNDLYGFQLSGDALLWNRGRFSLQAIGKAGVYYVRAHQSAFVEDPPGNAFNTFAGRSSDVAFVGEAGLNATFRLSDRVALRAGYQVLWVEGVALASDQVNGTPNLVSPPTPTPVNTHGGIFAHGAVAGLEFRW